MSRGAWIWTLMLLLVANAGAFWFVTLEGGRMQSPQGQGATNLDTLVLVSELPPAKVAAMRRDSIGSGDSAESGLQLPLDAVEGPAVDSIEAVLSGDTAVDPLPDIVVSATRIGAASAAAAEVPADTAGVAGKSALSDAGALQEIAVNARYFAEPGALPGAPPVAAVEEAAPAQLEAVEEPAKIPVCWEYGPLNDGQLQQLVAELGAQGLTSPHRSEEIVVSADYWVYLASDSIAKLQRLQLNLSARGVDSYVVSGGPLDGSLSLGLYPLEASARNVAAPLREEGYPVEIYVRPKETLQRHWLTLPEAAWTELRQSTLATQLPDATAQQTACPGAESAAVMPMQALESIAK